MTTNYIQLTTYLQPRDDVYGAYNPTYLPQSHGGTQGGPTTHTQSPIVTGT